MVVAVRRSKARAALAIILFTAALGSAWVGLALQAREGSQDDVLRQTVQSVASPGDARNAGRLAIWRISLEVIRDHPFVGIGPDVMLKLFPEYRTAEFDRSEGPNAVADKPHSSVLEWGVESGIPGAVLFLLLAAAVLGGAVTSLWRTKPSDGGSSDWALIGCWLAAFAYLAQSLITVTAIGVDTVWWILLGLVAAPARSSVPLVPEGAMRALAVPFPRPRLHAAKAGFTLIELLVVIIIIAILAAIAIPTYLGSRQKAQDAAAVSLLRNALTVVESANVERHDYSAITEPELRVIEPAIGWVFAAGDIVEPVAPLISNTVTAQARARTVEYYGQNQYIFDLATISESDNLFGIQVQTTGFATTSYVKVRVVEGESSTGW
jgi:prepilin-type N-terminal cleavage/methylation domain-containing protein